LTHDVAVFTSVIAKRRIRLGLVLGVAALSVTACSSPLPYVVLRDATGLTFNSTECLGPIKSVEVAAAGVPYSQDDVTSTSTWRITSADPDGAPFPSNGIRIGEVPEGFIELAPAPENLDDPESVVVTVEEQRRSPTVTFVVGDLQVGQYITVSNQRGEWTRDMAAGEC
jgi:hypothetical protein